MRFVPLTLLILFSLAGPMSGQEVNTQRIEKIREYVTQAGVFYKNASYEDAGKKIKAAQSLLERAFQEGSEADRDALEIEYRRIAKAHELLEKQAIKLPALVAIPEMIGRAEQADPSEPVSDPALDNPQPPSGDSQAISFKDVVAPLLVQHCGNCHVRGSKGKFNMGTFEQLLAGAEGKAMVPGKADESLIVQLVEAGKMPPRGKVPAADLNIIKSWIEQGGKFDGDDESAPIASGNANGPPRRGR
jgi:mono/diheme cytochrome c family protein